MTRLRTCIICGQPYFDTEGCKQHLGTTHEPMALENQDELSRLYQSLDPAKTDPGMGQDMPPNRPAKWPKLADPRGQGDAIDDPTSDDGPDDASPPHGA